MWVSKRNVQIFAYMRIYESMISPRHKLELALTRESIVQKKRNTELRKSLSPFNLASVCVCFVVVGHLCRLQEFRSQISSGINVGAFKLWNASHSWQRTFFSSETYITLSRYISENVQTWKNCAIFGAYSYRLCVPSATLFQNMWWWQF